MSTRLELQGLRELREALRNLPSELTEEANTIIRAQAEDAKREIQNAYPRDSGNLARGVTVEMNSSAFTANALVRSRARHAHLFEFGSQVRRTHHGASRGIMPAKPTFIPVMVRKRKLLGQALRTLLQRAGLVVSGSAE